MQWICGEHVERPIEYKVLDVEQKENPSIHGFYIRKPTNYVICVQQNTNLCWRRFVVCKEIFHVLLDSRLDGDTYRSTDIFSHVEEVTRTFPIAESRPRESAAIEQLAEIAAMEFMFPYEERVSILRNAEEQGTDVDYFQIADRYKVPQVYIELYLAVGVMEYFSVYLDD